MMDFQPRRQPDVEDIFAPSMSFGRCRYGFICKTMVFLKHARYALECPSLYVLSSMYVLWEINFNVILQVWNLTQQNVNNWSGDNIVKNEPKRDHSSVQSTSRDGRKFLEAVDPQPTYHDTIRCGTIHYQGARFHGCRSRQKTLCECGSESLPHLLV